MTNEQCRELVNRVLIEEFEVSPALLKPDATLGQELGLDSLDWVDLVVGIEKKFGCHLPEEQVRGLRTLQDVYDLLAAQTAAVGEGATK